MKKIHIIIALFLIGMSVSAQEVECDSISFIKERFEKLFFSKENEEAIICGKKLLTAWDSCHLEHDSVYCAIVMAMSNLYYFTGDGQQSIRVMKEIIPTVLNVFGRFHMDYVKSISDLALSYYSITDYKEAIRLQTDVVDIERDVLGEDHPLYLKSLRNLALYLSAMGNYEDAIRYATEAMLGQKKILGTDNPDYAKSLGGLAHYYSLAGNYTEALRLGHETIEIYSKVFGTDNPEYATALNNLAQTYSNIGNYSEAIKYGTQGMEIYRKLLGEKHPNYAICLGNLALYNKQIGDYNKAFIFSEMALKIFEASLGQDHMYYVTALSNIGSMHSALGQYKKGLEYQLIVLEKTKCSLGESHPAYAKTLNNIAVSYSELGDYAKAIEYASKAVEKTKIVLGENHVEYANTLSTLSGIYSNLGEKQKSIELCIMALDVLKSSIGENHDRYATTLNNLGSLYSEIGNNIKALESYKKSLSIQKNIVGDNHPDYITSLNNIATYYSDNGDNAKAIDYGKTVLEKSKMVYGENHPKYALYLSNLGNYYEEEGNLSPAIDYCNKALTIYKNTLGETHPDYIGAISNMAMLYYKNGDYSKAYNLLKNVTSNLSSNVIKAFGTLTSRQRFLFWSKYFYLYTDYYPSFFYMSKSCETTDLYDKSALFSKELLLSTEMEISKQIKEGDDEEALKLFEDLRIQRLQIQRIQEQPVKDRQIIIDSLETNADNIERRLISRCNAYGKFIRSGHTIWRDIQESLSDDEIAVEFLYFMIPKTDSVMVAALTLRKDDISPKFYPLFELKQLLQNKGENHYISSKVTSLVWRPIEKELLGIKRIYFSPAGALNRIGIEYAPGMDSYDFYRLSSTKNIVEIKKEDDHILNEKTDVVLYGGINYEELESAIPNQDKTPEDTILTEIDISLHRAFVDSLDLRGMKLNYLPSSFVEVNNISATLARANYSNTIRTGRDATETSVKALSSSPPSILHISTHGFYYSEDQELKNKLLQSMNFEEMSSKMDIENRALSRSGLFMAGAYQTISHQKESKNDDDGILTAREISNIDLLGVDLVVLSACETGSGDVARGEGVFGLQRGFKKAGVKTILMSLWRVSDVSTEMLMTEFYKNLCNGKSKRESLRLAQKTVREYKDEDGNLLFEDPHYWAGFIMLD